MITINDLPTEIQIPILTEACNRRKYNQGTPILQLGGVCRLWRQVLWGAPQLWSEIRMFCNAGDYDTNFITLNDWLQRSGTLPLTIFIDGDSQYPTIDPEDDNVELEQHVSKCFSRILAEHARWTALHLVLSFGEPLYMLNDVGASITPLHSFSLKGDFHQKSEVFLKFLSQQKELVSLELGHTGRGCGSVFVEEMFGFGGNPHQVRFGHSVKRVMFSRIEGELVQQLFSSLPNVEYLLLDGINAEDSDSSLLPPVMLDKLRTLVLVDAEWSLDLLSAPNLEALEVAWDPISPMTAEASTENQALLRFLQDTSNGGARPSRLAYQLKPLTNITDLAALLRYLANSLEDLAVSFAGVAYHDIDTCLFWDMLFRNEREDASEGVILPRLGRLRLSFDPNSQIHPIVFQKAYEALGRWVDSRSESGRDESRALCLRLSVDARMEEYTSSLLKRRGLEIVHDDTYRSPR